MFIILICDYNDHYFISWQWHDLWHHAVYCIQWIDMMKRKKLRTGALELLCIVIATGHSGNTLNTAALLNHFLLKHYTNLQQSQWVLTNFHRSSVEVHVMDLWHTKILSVTSTMSKFHLHIACNTLIDAFHHERCPWLPQAICNHMAMQWEPKVDR